jgi:hypothetical protein
MKITSISKIFFVTMFAVVLVLTNYLPLHAGSQDTPDNVMLAGKNASAQLNSMELGLKDAQAIAARLGQDRAFATKALEAAKKNDQQGLAQILKSVAPNSQITIQQIGDFFFDGFLTIGGTTYRLCFSTSSDCKHPSGAKSPIVFSQF